MRKPIVSSARLFPMVLAAAVSAFLFAEPASAQQARVTSEKPSFDDLPSPEFPGNGKQKSFKQKDWLEMEAKIKVELAPEPPSKTCESVTVKWYVAVKNPDRPSTYLLLTKDVEHVNVPLNEEIYTSVYLSPASIKRLTGSDRGGKGSVDVVGYEVFINGQKYAEQTSKLRPGWWNSQSGKISRNDSVPLLDKSETPFAPMWWDRYAEVKAKNR